VEIGRCQGCGRRVQGRHPRQVSDALDVGGVHFGPGVIGLTAHLNKTCGLSYGKIAGLLSLWMGLLVERSSLCRALRRYAQKARCTYDALTSTIRGSPVVAGDETGWKLGGERAWLWGFTTGLETVYQICSGRGFNEAAQVLGEDFSGILVVDGWAPYRKFEEATLQTCLTHLLRRCSEILKSATRGAVRFPRAVREILETALEIRDRRDLCELTPHGVLSLCGRLKARMSRLLSGRFTNAENARFAKHLRNYEAALFVFLEVDGVEATNWQAEHAMRAAVITRKCCGGGNRTEAGAETQAILMSVLRTCHQKALDPLVIAAEILRPCDEPQSNMQLVAG
jgi:transposase